MWNMANTGFTDWLVSETESRGWSYRELGRRAELSASTISKVISGASFAGLEFCTGIARAFGLAPDIVLRKAGLLPPITEETATVRQVAFLVSQLPPEEQEKVLAMIEALSEQHDKQTGGQYVAKEAPANAGV